MSKQDLRQVFSSQAGRWPSMAGLSGARPTFRFTPARPRGDNPPPPEPAAPDLTNPAIVAAITEASQKAVKAAQEGWTKEKEAILGNKETILGEKKKLEEVLGGKKPEEISASLKRLAEIEAKEKAGEHGKSGEEWTAAVEQEAQKKHQVWRSEQAELMQKDKEEIGKLKAENERLAKAEHRSWCAAKLARAAMPPDYKYLQEGAEEMLLDRLVPVMEKYKEEGLPDVARFKVGGTLLAGTGLGGYMTEREFLDKGRAGQIPNMPELSIFFVSQGKGSGTESAAQVNASASGNWGKMTTDERAAYINKHGAEKAKELINQMAEQRAAEKAA